MAIDIFEREVEALLGKPERETRKPEADVFKRELEGLLGQREIASDRPDIDIFERELESLTGQRVKPAVPLWKKPSRSLIAGFGDTMKTAGYALDWMGVNGDWAKEAGRELSKRWEVPEEDPKEFEWENFLDPHWLATRVPRALAFSLSLVPAALVGAAAVKYVGVPTATALGVGKLGAFGKTILGSLGATALSRPIESALEAGNTYEMAQARGDSEEEAREMANQTFRENLGLAGMDVTQLALAFTPLGKGKAFTRTFARRIAAATGKMAGVGAMEAGEEIIQDVIQRRALGEEIGWDPRMKESAALGGVMGIGLGGAGSVYNVLVERTKRNLPLSQQKRIRAAREGLTGVEAQRAELFELDKIAETEEGSAAIDKTVKEIMAFGEEFDAEQGIPVERVGEATVTPEPTPAVAREVAPEVKPEPAIPKELEPLAREARKYKIAEEFAEAVAKPKFVEVSKSLQDQIIKNEMKFAPKEDWVSEKNLREIAKGFRVHLDTKRFDVSGLSPVFSTVKEATDFHAQATKAPEPAPVVAPMLVEAERVETVEPAPEVPAIPKELESLIREARKYKIAKEFEKSQIQRWINYGHTRSVSKALAELEAANVIKKVEGVTKGVEVFPFSVRIELPDGTMEIATTATRVKELAKKYGQNLVTDFYAQFIKAPEPARAVAPELVPKVRLPEIKPVKSPVRKLVKEPEIKLLAPIELANRIKRGEKIVEGEGFTVKVGGKPTTRLAAMRAIEKEQKRREKEIARARTKAEKEALKEARQAWLNKIGLAIQDKYPFATKEQRQQLHIDHPEIARALSHNIDWDKLEPWQQAMISLSIRKKKNMPVHILVDAIEKSKLIVPGMTIKNLKNNSPIKKHFAKVGEMPKMPTATVDNISVPEKATGGAGLTPIIEKFIADMDWDSLEKALPSYPKEIMKVAISIATEKRKLRAQFRRGEITEARIKNEFVMLNEIMRKALEKYNMAIRVTKPDKKGFVNVAPALIKSGHNVTILFAKGKMKDCTGLDTKVADPITQATTIDNSSYGLFAQNVLEVAQQGEIARDQSERIYQHKIRQVAEKHKILYGSLYGASKRERLTIGRLADVLTVEELNLPTKEILALDKVKKIMAMRYIKERDIVPQENLINFLKEARPIMDDIRRVANIFRVKYGKEPMGYIEAYLPHMQETNTRWAVFGKENRIKNVMMGLLPDFIFSNQVESAHAKARKYGLKTYELDFFNVFDTYSSSMMKSIFNTMIIHNNKIHAEVMRGKGLVNAASWLDTWTAQSYAGVLGWLDKTVLTMSPKAYRALGWYRQALMRMVFPFNLGWSIVTQPSSIIITLARVGPIHLARGAYDWFITGENREKIKQGYVYLVKNQQRGTVSYQDIQKEVDFIERGVLDKWQDLGCLALRFEERHLTGWSIAAGYSKHRADGLTGKGLDNAAQHEGAFTQSMYNFTMRPLLLQSRTITSVIPFQTFVFQMFNLSKEIAGVTGKTRQVNERLAMAFYVIVGAMLWNEYVSEKLAGRKLWSWRSVIPFSGAIWSPFDKDRSPVSFVATYNQLHEAMDRYLTTGNFTPLRRFLTQWGTSMAGVGGGLKMNRVINAAIASYKRGIYTRDDRRMVKIGKPEEKARAFLFGPWATRRGQEHWNLRDNPGLGARAWNWVMGKQPVSYNVMKRNIIKHIREEKHQSMRDVKNDAELREMMAEFNIQARERYHRSLFVRGKEHTIPEKEYFSELRRRTIDYKDVLRWLKLEREAGR